MENFYINMLKTIRHYPILEKTIVFITHYFPYIIFCLYPCVLIYLFIFQNDLLMEMIIKPMLAFFLVTILRKLINRPRPYESMNIQPLVDHKSGESFPSRHAVSAMIIALMCFKVHIDLGIFALVIAILICSSRILAGVHHISDVLVSIMIAVIIYLIKIF